MRQHHMRPLQQEVDKAFEVFRAYREIVPLEGENYTVDHSAGVYLYDAQGGFVGTLDKDEPAETRMTKVERLLDGAQGVAAGDRAGCVVCVQFSGADAGRVEAPERIAALEEAVIDADRVTTPAFDDAG